ncbi:MAG: hypothetical protein K5799_11380 [Erythrobacter sp.]|nr:hypothetical protein [Erythrobacter sp.]
MLASSIAFYVAEPAHVLTLAPGIFPFAPFVRRVSQTQYRAEIGGQKRLNELLRSSAVQPVHALRYDRTATELTVKEEDGRGAVHLVIHPAIPLGLIWTMRECEDVEAAMRQLFENANVAKQAATDVTRLVRQIGLETGTLIEDQ